MASSGSSGSIVMCSSVMSQRAQVTFKTGGIYAASKAGVDMLVRYGAIEVSRVESTDVVTLAQLKNS